MVCPQKGDILFSRANTREKLGASAIIYQDYPDLILPDKLWKLRFSDSVNIFWIKYVFSTKSIRNKFSSISTGTSGTMYNISMEKFKTITIPLPPTELQNEFGNFAQKATFLKKAIANNEDRLADVKESLMSEHFNGI